MTEQIGDLWLEHRPPSAGPRRGPLLLVHGMWGGSWYWANYVGLFAAAGWDCWALNLRGHHGSRPVPDVGRVRVRDYVADVLAVVAAVGEPAVIGHSMGGLVAQKAAETTAFRAAVFLTSAPPRGILAVRGPVLWRLLPYTRALLGGRPFVPRPRDAEALFLNNLAPDVRREAYARLVPESGRAAREMALGRVAVDAARVRCPTLVVGALRDRITPVAIQRRIAAKYRSDYRELDGHAHMPMIEAGWDAVGQELAAWLAKVTG